MSFDTKAARDAIAAANPRNERGAAMKGLILCAAYLTQAIKEIGEPPEGSHPAEAGPRAETWHRERANWVEQTRRQSAEIDRLRAELNRIIATTSEPVIRIMAEKAIREA